MIKRIAQALGFAAILLLPNYIDLTSSSGDERMRAPQPLTQVALAQLTDLLIVAVIFLCLMAFLRRLRIWTKLRWALMALLPPFFLARNLDVFPFDVPHIAVLAASLLWIVSLALLILRAPAFVSKLRLFGSAVLTGLAVFTLVAALQLVRAALWRPSPQSFATPIPAPPANKPRMIWILFDELAYKPAFEARDPSLQLPNFDRLRRESTLYTQVTPIGYRTIHVIPSLLSGRMVTNDTFTTDNQFLVESEDSPQWHRFDTNATLIGMARQRGATTSIVGWYLPYCPIFESTATQCYWDNQDTEDRGPTWSDASFAENVWLPLRILAEQYIMPGKVWADLANWKSRGHIASVRNLSQHTLQTLAASQADFIYVHLPVPHPPGFWNRRTGKFAPGGSYLDSLDYSDRLLGQILDELQAQPRWAATTLIVQGDHSWRTKMWRPQPGWGAEDERVSHGGQWDPRPLLLIHQAGEQDAKTVAAPTSLMFVHDFVAAKIQGLDR